MDLNGFTLHISDLKWSSPTHTQPRQPARVSHAHTPRERGDVELPWPSLDLSILGSGDKPAPFPCQVLGHHWSEWVRNSSEATSSPPDYVGVALLVTAASLIGNARRIRAWGSWTEPPVLWAALVGPPSSHKSPALDVVLTAVSDLEAEDLIDLEMRLRDYETHRVQANVMRERWESEIRDAASTGAPPPTMPAEALQPDRPERYRVRVADATPEALVRIAAQQSKGLLLVRDELAGWLGSFDRYTSGRGADRAFFLEAFGARSYVSDRVGNTAGPIAVKRNAISILGTIQPDRLQAALLSGCQDGLAARFLLAYPAPIERRRPRSTPDNLAALWRLRRLRDLELCAQEDGKSYEPLELPLSSSAAARFEDWWRLNGSHDIGGQLSAWRGKADGWVLRIALVLEHLWWSAEEAEQPRPRSVSERAVEAAILILETYFWPMAIRCFGASGLGEKYANAVHLATYLADKRPHRINARTLYKSAAVKGIKTAAAANDACELLSQLGWVRPNRSRQGPSVGRQSNDFEVNPAVWQLRQ
jgi:hypothetical protein